MSSKLSQFVDGVMESAWILALIVAPVFFNIYSSRIFEPDKISVVRSLAVVILFAWLVKLFEDRSNRSVPGIPGGDWFKRLMRFPIAVPVFALAVIFILATIFSVTPRVSLWGSYQRLQGLYTTFAYLVIFASIAGNLRRREQVQRLITVAIVSSLPVSLYGIIQRFKLDPIPWGGDVSLRIASNMGNSIFVAAFLIMVFPATLIRILETIEAIMKGKNTSWVEFIGLVGYFFIAALQLTALYFTGSRGPWLGWAASMVFLWLGFSIVWRKRWMSITGISLAAIAALFLIVLNIPGGPLENLRKQPEFGRLGQLLDAESRTGRVRTLIWQGAAQLVFPHQPIEYPDGSKDPLNFIRPVIGYGPESMYVAYNPFYPPELTQVEKRNASPDRSHNETWDALVTTGLTGLVVYLSLFGSVIYYGLKWLGLMQGKKERNLFLGLYLGGGIISSLVFLIWKGIPYLGVALPFGMIIGVMVYLVWNTLRGQFSPPSTVLEKSRSYLILGVLAAILAHFVEINFGIAIVSTRTYFWIYSALLVTTGKILPEIGEFGQTAATLQNSASGENGSRSIAEPGAHSIIRDKSKSRKTTAKGNRSKAIHTSRRESRLLFQLPDWIRLSLMSGLIVAMLLSTLGFLYITNASRNPSVFGTIWNSLIILIKDSQSRSSTGILVLFLSTAIIGMGLFVANLSSGEGEPAVRFEKKAWKILGLGTFLALILTLAFWVFHARNLVELAKTTANTIDDVLRQVQKSENILTGYYAYMFLLVMLLAFALAPAWPEKSFSNLTGVIFALGALLITFFLVIYSNLRIIQADMSFKTAEIFAQPSTWPVAIRIYERANDLAPNEDFYYLFLGRAYLEYARSLENLSDRDQLIQQAASDLRKAQSINPLNPDHTANLARLHSLWAASTNDQEKRRRLAKISDDYFSRAVALKPKDAKLWDEWALLYLNILDQPEEALRRLKIALEIDPFYDWTYGLLGDYTQRFLAETEDPQSVEWSREMNQAANYLISALKYSDANNSTFKYNYAVSLAAIQIQLGLIEEAIQTYELALNTLPENSDNWKIYETLARLYFQIGDESHAISNALLALEKAPEDQKSRLEEFMSSLGG